MPRLGEKYIDTTITDVVNMTDAIFEGSHDDDRHGWVAMAANAKGREYIDALFPEAHITWRDPGEGLPDDWVGFHINLPDTIAPTKTRLPMEITRGADLNVANPNALTYLLAAGVHLQGVHRAVWFEDHLEIYVPPAGNN